MSLLSTLTEIKKIKKFAEEDVNSGPIETLNARRGRKAQAIETLKRLKREYKKEMTSTALFIVSTGSGREDFTRIASESFGWFSANPETFYEDLSKRVHPELYLKKQSVSNVFDVLGRHLEDKMNELDLTEYNQLLFKSHLAKIITSPEDFKNIVKQAVNEQIGSEIAGIQALHTLVDAAINKDHKENIMPIILTTDDEKFALSLAKDLKRLTGKVFLAVTGEASPTLLETKGALLLKEASKASVKSALSTLSKGVKK